jgi:hypothetical protein
MYEHNITEVRRSDLTFNDGHKAKYVGQETYYECSCGDKFDDLENAQNHVEPHPVIEAIRRTSPYSVEEDCWLNEADEAGVTTSVDINIDNSCNSTKIGASLFHAIRNAGWEIHGTMTDPTATDADARVWVRPQEESDESN